MADRYFVDEPIAAETAGLTGGEAHHLIHVLRAKPGGEVILFDGGGSEYLARIERVGRTDVSLAIVERRSVDLELPARLILGVALPKGDRQKWLVEKAVELGVARLVPLETERSVAQPSAEAGRRLRRAVIEAAKQCGRNRLMEIAAGESLATYLQSAPSSAAAGASTCWLAHPSGGALRSSLEQLGPVEVPTESWLAIGPEGGFTEAEVELARWHAWQVVSLGRRILRIETAACHLVANLAARWEN
jgi:16S rRNA (uracil1498-N3)-methyltransferase